MIPDDEVRSARELAEATIRVMDSVGIKFAGENSMPHKIIALCDEVDRLKQSIATIERERDEWKAQYHGSIDRARIAEQDRAELDEMLTCHRGMCSNREPHDDPHVYGARCVRYLGHPAPCRWSRP